MNKKSLFKLPYEIVLIAAACKILFGENYFYGLGIIAGLVLMYRFGNQK